MPETIFKYLFDNELVKEMFMLLSSDFHYPCMAVNFYRLNEGTIHIFLSY